METCLQPLWNLLREPCNQLMEISDFEDNSNRQILMQKRKDLLTECEDILHIFWKDPDEFINLKKPKHIATQVIAKLAVLVRNLEPKQGRIREEHDLWNEKWIIAHVRRTLISYGLYESGKS